MYDLIIIGCKYILIIKLFTAFSRLNLTGIK